MRCVRIFAGLAAWWLGAFGLGAAELLPIEREVAKIVEQDKVTIVHFWAPWCSNCRAELAKAGWKNFIDANPDVEVIFITIWSDTQGDGRALLEQYGVGGQKNFRLLLHPNTSRRSGDKVGSFLGMPVSWVPTTWVFREGALRFALNYGEVRFSVLQQLVEDSADKW